MAILSVLAAAFLLLPGSDSPTENADASIRIETLADAAPTTAEAEAVADQAAADPDTAASATGPIESDQGASSASGDELAEPTSPDTTTTSSSTSTSTTTTTIALVEATTTTVSGETTTTTSAAPLSIGQEALNRVVYPWQEKFPEWEVVFRGPRDGIRALTFPEEKRIEIFIRSSDTTASLHRVFAHELGHVIDVEFNSGSDRDRWVAQRGLPSAAPWWPTAEAPDFATGAGDFAEAFAVWETGVTTRSTLGGQPTADDLALLRELSEL